jgi:ankyrin repeat protein
MDKFREKYALHKKYQLSSSSGGHQPIISTHDSSTTTCSQGDSRNVPQKINDKHKKHVEAVGEDIKTSASSSVTLSTASASFDSGETKSMSGVGDPRMSSRNHRQLMSNPISHRSYQALGSGSSRYRDGFGHQHGYLAVEHENEEEEEKEEVTSTSVNDKLQNKKMTFPEDECNHRTIPTDNSRQSIKNRYMQSNRQDDDDGSQQQQQQQQKQIVSEYTTPSHISTPARNKHTLQENSTAFNPTPPRVAQKHTSVQMVPTEAQLRWAQFHQKKRAIMTRDRIEKLMRSPLCVDDVPGATSGDGDPFENEMVSTVGKRQWQSITSTKLKMSRGRRALLRISERRTEERRQFIKEHGFKMLPDDDESVNDQDGLQSSAYHQSSIVDDSLAFDDISDALQVGDNSTLLEDQGVTHGENTCKNGEQSISAVNGMKQKQKNLRRKTRHARRLKGIRSMALTADEDEERMRRFEEAYTLMCSVKKKDDNVITSKKRWTRGSHVPVAVSIDGRIYSDLQRSPTMKFVPDSKRYGTEVVGAELNGKTLTDRGATWMMHLPKRERHQSNNSFSQSSDPSIVDEKCTPNADLRILSPGKKKLMEIVDKMQAKKTHVKLLFRSFDHNQGNTSPERTSANSQAAGVVTKSKTSKQLPSDIKFEAVTSSRNMMRSLGVSVQNMKDRIAQSFRTEEERKDDVEYENSIHTEESDPVYEQKIQMIAAQIKSNSSVIDTDDQSDVSGGIDALQQERIGSLMMSPTVISKRLNQAITAVRLGQWDKVGYLILANPWLAEMTDVTSDQYLIHKLAYYGGGTVSDTNDFHDPAPKKLNADIIKVSSTAICKFDSFGNLPLHRAAEAGNTDMTNRLIKAFPGGGSVRNNDGQLPLHLAVLACANEMVKSPLSIVFNVLSSFSSGLAIADNDGNLPIHLAVAYVPGDLGARLVHLLLEEAEKHRSTLRFPQTIKTLKDSDDALTDPYSIVDDDKSEDEPSILSVKNALGWNAIVTALHMAAGFEVLDVLLSHPDAESMVYERDQNGQSLLHLSMSVENCESSSIISLVKSFPDLVTFRDENGALPIEIACMRDLPTEVIVAIALLDLPIDLDDDEVVVRDGFGGSWWYLNCDCDDNYVHVVCEILGICDDYKQKRALCFLKDRQGNNIMTRATPKCQHELRKTLRFHGRYEFLSKLPTSDNGVKEFDALDFGPENETRDEGKPVMIKYYEDDDAFEQIVST